MALGFLHFVEPIVGHAIFRDRLDQAEVGLGSASRTAKGLGAIVDVVQASEIQACVAPADIAAEPHLSVGLGERAEGEGAMRPGSNHGAKLEPVGSSDESTFCLQCRHGSGLWRHD
jgi:hypothetical protein